MIAVSLCIYLSVFIISSYACYCYEKIEDRCMVVHEKSNSRGLTLCLYMADFLKLFYACLVLCPPIFISTFRDLSVGTDTANYLVIYDYIKHYNLLEYVSLYGSPGYRYEIGFQQIQHLAYVTGGGFNFVKFICSFLIIFFLWRGTLYYHKKIQINTGYCMLFFYLLDFTFGLNGIRNAIGYSIYFYGVQFVIEKKFFKYLVCCFTMCLFHTSMLIVLPLYMINFLDLKKVRKYWASLAVVVIIVLLALLRFLMTTVLPQISGMIPNLGNYDIINSDYGLGIYFITGVFLLPLLRWNRFIRQHVDWTYILMIVLLFIPLRFLGYFNHWFTRLQIIADIFFGVLYCGAMKLPVSFSEKLFWKLYTLSIVFISYLYLIVVNKNHEVYPYIFDFTNHL